VVLKALIAGASAILVAYLLGIVGGQSPVIWEYATGSWCENHSMPSFALVVDETGHRVVARVDALNRNNPTDSGDLDVVAHGGCERITLHAPGETRDFFVAMGQRSDNAQPYQQKRIMLDEKSVCRWNPSGSTDRTERSAYVDVQRARPGSAPSAGPGCGAQAKGIDGPLFAVGGEMPGAPPYLDFSRQGAFLTVSFEGASATPTDSDNPAQFDRSAVFWLLIPPEHTLLVQRTTPAPIAAIPTNRGTLYKFSIALLPLPVQGNMGGHFVVGALSFVYESDLRASLRDYLIFVLAAVFAFALERLVDCMAKRE
jgi:hypothetical protein